MSIIGKTLGNFECTALTGIGHLHNEARESLKLNPEFVIHSLRHTFLTRLGEAGADAFTAIRLAGHSSITMSQRYVYPTPAAMERAMERLDSMNQEALKGLKEIHKESCSRYNFRYISGSGSRSSLMPA